MRTKLVILLLIFNVVGLKAQENLLVVEYSEKVQLPEGLLDYKSFLFSSKQSRYFLSLRDNEMKESKAKLVADGISITRKTINREVFMDIKDNILKDYILYEDDLGDHYYLELSEELPKMKWKLLAETKVIHQYKCNKAVVYFRGREYVAWYTTAIPVSAGPWKFHGLPGLILEVRETSENKFSWEATAVQYPYQGNLNIPEPKNDFVKMTTKEFIEVYLPKNRAKTLAIRTSRIPREWGGGVTITHNYLRIDEELLYEWEPNYPKDK